MRFSDIRPVRKQNRYYYIRTAAKINIKLNQSFVIRPSAKKFLMRKLRKGGIDENFSRFLPFRKFCGRNERRISYHYKTHRDSRYKREHPVRDSVCPIDLARTTCHHVLFVQITWSADTTLLPEKSHKIGRVFESEAITDFHDRKSGVEQIGFGLIQANTHGFFRWWMSPLHRE